MATESFFEDLVIDTPEAIANWKAFLKEQPHLVVDPDIVIVDADEETVKRLMSKYIEKD